MRSTTLQELRVACALAEQEREGGLSARVSPLAQVRDAGNLLGRAGLSLPAVDVDTLVVRYAAVPDAVAHLRALGEGNAVRARRAVLRRDSALAAAAAYATLFPALEEGQQEQQNIPDGGVCATFQVIFATGWAPDASQQRARARGSATASLADLERGLREQQERDKAA